MSRMQYFGLLLVGLIVLATSAPVAAGPVVSVERLGGQDRYGTAARIATDTFDRETSTGEPNSPSAVLARGDMFPDALAATYFAGHQDAPVLLTETTRLPQQTLDAFDQLGTESVTLIGDTTAISAAVEDELNRLGMTTERYQGGDRYETAANVAKAFSGSEGVFNGKLTAVVASGQNFPDALAAGPVTFAENFPLLLTPKDDLSPQTADVLRALGIGQVFIVGGTGAVSTSVQEEIEALGIDVRRLAGTSRQSTAVAIAEFARTELRWLIDRVELARGDGFADAIAGGPRGGELRAPVLLTSTPTDLSDTTETYLRERRATISTIDVFGGTGAVSDKVADEARHAATGL